MSKPNMRILVSLLLSFSVLVAVFSVVQGAALNAGARSGQAHVDAGLMPDFSRARSSGQQAPVLEQYYYDNFESGHGCEKDRTHPDD